MVEILWWVDTAIWEFKNSDFSSQMKIDWDYSLVIRYKRERDNICRTACALSFDLDEEWNICINQLQWSNDKKVSFRFHSSFNDIGFYAKLIEESFSKKWIYVYVTKIPVWLEWASYSSKAGVKYNTLSNICTAFNNKYGLEE
jgi:hypothetical protein